MSPIVIHAASLSCGARLEVRKAKLPEMFEVWVHAKTGLVASMKLEVLPEDWPRLCAFIKETQKKASAL